MLKGQTLGNDPKMMTARRKRPVIPESCVSGSPTVNNSSCSGTDHF